MYCKYLYLLIIIYSNAFISNCTNFFNNISTELIKNQINLDLMQNMTDKFLFSLFKLILKVRLYK